MAKGQSLNTFNINIDNGLPSNHVYGFITDKYGYLWICTEKGVVRYNGYECRLFNLSDGLPTEDVWQMTEDKRGRIWLGNISDEIGYLYNDKYFKAYMPGPPGIVYPRKMSPLGTGISFISNHNKADHFLLYVANNDTIHGLEFIDSMFIRQVPGIKNVNDINMSQSENGVPVFIHNRNIYHLQLKNHRLNPVRLSTIDTSISEEQLNNTQNGIWGNYLFLHPSNSKSNVALYINMLTGQRGKIDLRELSVNGDLCYTYPDAVNKKVYFISHNKIVEFSYMPSLTFLHTYQINDFVPEDKVDGSTIKCFRKGLPYWGNCIGTTTNGVWINSTIQNYFHPVKSLDFKDYQFLSCINDSVCYWWNATAKTIAEINKNLKVNYYPFNEPGSVKSIRAYSSDTLLISAIPSYSFTHKTKLFVPTLPGLNDVIYSIKDSSGSLYAICLYGFCRINTSSGLAKEYLDRTRYAGLVYDAVRKDYWAYNYNNIHIHKQDGRDKIISKDELGTLGVKKVEKIIIDDNYGNVFIKGYDNISMYDPVTGTYKELFKKVNLRDATLFVYHEKLVVTGRFGVLFSDITGPGQVSGSVEYMNLKNINYTNIYSSQVAWGSILLSTDNGVYTVALPSADSMAHTASADVIYPYKFILNYKDSTYDIPVSDTIAIDQKDLKLKFDIINPYGNGKVKYLYKLNNEATWHLLNANELHLPGMATDHYYKLTISAYDQVWKSDTKDIYLFIRPYWWQTIIGKRILWISGVLIVLLLFATAIAITRGIVLRASRQKQERMQLELKSIYSQINPHFIFNSLNSALLLVSRNKMQDAYSHISKFSRLLRAYIKSSRNKYITIGDEINNLKDYLELQQVRFKDKFEYQFILDDNISDQNISIPSLLLQPFVENAINHGILPNDSHGILKISFQQLKGDDEIICTIEDNGIGRKRSKILQEQQQIRNESYGDLLVKELVSIFNQYEDMNITITSIDKEEPNTGTIVIIKIKRPHHAK